MLDNSKNTGAKKIRIAMAQSGIVKIAELADKLNCSSSNVSTKLKRNNFCESDFRNIAEALGYDVEINLVSKDTGEKI